VGEVIRRTFGVTYDPSHSSHLLHRLRDSVQRPIERATQRDEAAIRGWWEQRWPFSTRLEPAYSLAEHFNKWRIDPLRAA